MAAIVDHWIKLPFFLPKLARRPRLNYFSFWKDDDFIEIQHCLQPMGDRDDRLPSKLPPQHFLDDFIGFMVDVRGRLIQYKKSLFLENGAGQAD